MTIFNSGSSQRPSKTIRELGGEVWAELSLLDDVELSWQVRNSVVDIVMGVLARHAGTILENDLDLPVAPLPEGGSRTI